VSTWKFTTPHADEGPASWDDWLFVRIKLARGITILENPPGTFTAVQFPTQDEILASAPRFYMGGHEYVVSDQDKADLIAANVGVTNANFVLIS